ncbi:MAG TPA: NAD(P)H-hydrate dehydratase, partial [Flavisolibacter sp.]
GHEPIDSIDLMERAASRCVDWISTRFSKDRTFRIFCGKGNNGGDGLAIDRMLVKKNYPLAIYILETGKDGTNDFEVNLGRLKDLEINIQFIHSPADFPIIDPSEIVIDALFGTGLNKPLEGTACELVKHINHSQALVLSIDLPSGLFADVSSLGNSVIRADHTLSFQCYKKGLLVQENGIYTGLVHLVDIGLDPGFVSVENINTFYVVDRLAKTIYKPRNAFAHKGHYGHSLLIAGSYGKMGAALLAAKACVRSGAGLLTAYVPACGYEIMQTSVPECMVITDDDKNILTQLPEDIEKYSSIGIGPGIGTADATRKLMSFIIRRYRKPLVIDADGLNCLSLQKQLLEQLPVNSILTPHPKEFDRLFGDHANDFDRLDTAIQKSKELKVIIVLKGHHSYIATPEGNSYFNSTGNAGMANGGSGDVLTGIITALLAQQYQPSHAAILGVYLHGLAGDFAADAFSKEAMTPSDMIACLSNAFLQFRGR